MSDPYHHPSLNRDQTMYLSALSHHDFPPPPRYQRHSSFQMHDIAGTTPKVLIPHAPHDSFSLSTFVEPVPDRARRLSKQSDPLLIDDIEGARPRVSHFRTRRVVDPLTPKYQLPSAAEIAPHPGRNFIRDTLQVADITAKRTRSCNKGQADPIEGSSPTRLFRKSQAVSRLDVKDINRDGGFQSQRTTDPQHPQYLWRDGQEGQLNRSYGAIEGIHPRQIHPTTIARRNNYCLGISDIDGAQAGSGFARSHFVDKRREFRNYMLTRDIEHAEASTLKKGIETSRKTNPLMPRYQLPGHSAGP